MNRVSRIYGAKWMLAATAMALCVVALALPLATACARGTELAVARLEDDGYGTHWFVDPGEWYVAPAAPVVQAGRAQPAGDGYGTAWYVDPGEWFVAPEVPVALASRAEPEDDGYGTAWFADPGEWDTESEGGLDLAR